MNLQQIQYILAVAEYQHFKEAAEQCYITQSTLSTMIGRFETEIGIKIFDRKTKPVSITKEGQKIIEQLRLIRKEIDVLQEVVQGLKGELSGTLSIGVIPTVAPYLLPRFMNQFAQKNPKISFRVSEMTTQAIVEALQKRSLDIGVLAVPIDGYFEEIPLYNEPFVLFDCNAKSSTSPIELARINYDKLWLLQEGHCMGKQVERICKLDRCDVGQKNDFEFRAGSIDSLIRFVKINKGLTLLPYLAALDLTDTEFKKVRFFKNPVPVRTIGLMVHSNFVKKEILYRMKEEIQTIILPLLPKESPEYVVSPL